jgi:hypothetical protein
VLETVTHGLRRVVAVVAGVLLAITIARFVVLSWWTLGIVLALAFTIGAVLRLGDHATEVAISAMLVFAVRSADSTAVTRASETLIGAAVGVALSFLTGPLHVEPAGSALRALGERIGTMLDDAAQRIGGQGSDGKSSGGQGSGGGERPLARGDAERLLSQARRLSGEVERVDASLDRAERSLRMNPRAARYRATTPSWRAALSALEHVVVSVREVMRVLVERADASDEGTVDVGDPAAVAELFRDLANAVRAFGRVAVGDAAGASGQDADLRAALERARASQGRLHPALLVDAAAEPELWALHGALLQAIDRVLREIDLEAGAEARQVARDGSAAERPFVAGARRVKQQVRSARRTGGTLAAQRFSRASSAIRPATVLRRRRDALRETHAKGRAAGRAGSPR